MLTAPILVKIHSKKVLFGTMRPFLAKSLTRIGATYTTKRRRANCSFCCAAPARSSMCFRCVAAKRSWKPKAGHARSGASPDVRWPVSVHHSAIMCLAIAYRMVCLCSKNSGNRGLSRFCAVTCRGCSTSRSEFVAELRPNVSCQGICVPG